MDNCMVGFVKENWLGRLKGVPSTRFRPSFITTLLLVLVRKNFAVLYGILFLVENLKIYQTFHLFHMNGKSKLTETPL